MKTRLIAIGIFIAGVAVGALASHVLAGRDGDGVLVRRGDNGWIEVHRNDYTFTERQPRDGQIYDVLSALLEDEWALHARDAEPVDLRESVREVMRLRAAMIDTNAAGR